MFVLSQNRSSVILGPMEYNKSYFQVMAKNDLDLDVDLPSDATGYVNLGNNLELFPVTEVRANVKSKIEQPAGPFLTYSGETCTATYTAVPKNIDVVKNELKAIFAANRYKKEVGGVKITLQGKEVTALTGREDRNLYLQAVQLGAANTAWKFNGNVWLTLSLAELGDIVTAVMNHVKTSFEEEAAKAAEIDACTTLEQLDAIVLPSNGPVLP